jgi:hypothetical protein
MDAYVLTTVFCEQCGARLGVGAKFCGRCGAASSPQPEGGHEHTLDSDLIDEPARGIEATLTTDEKAGIPRIGWVVGGLLLAAAAVIFLIGSEVSKSIVGAVGTAGCADGLRQIKTAAAKWDDEIRVANQTPRIALAAQISRMQQVKRDTAAITARSCLGDGKLFDTTVSSLVRYMNVTIDVFVQFLAHESPDGTLIDRARDRFVQDLEVLAGAIAAADGHPSRAPCPTGWIDHGSGVCTKPP